MVYVVYRIPHNFYKFPRFCEVMECVNKFKPIAKIANILGGKASNFEKGDNNQALSPVGQITTLKEAAALLKEQGAAVAVLAVQDLQAYWLSIMQDKKASYKDKLAASKMYAQSIGAFDAKQQQQARAPEGYKWADATVIDVPAAAAKEDKETEQAEDKEEQIEQI